MSGGDGACADAGAMAGETGRLVAGWAERGIFGWADLARSRAEMRGVPPSVRLRADACEPPGYGSWRSQIGASVQPPNERAR